MSHSDASCKIMYGNLFLGAAVLIHCPSAHQNARGEAIDRATPTPSLPHPNIGAALSAFVFHVMTFYADTHMCLRNLR